MIQNLADNFFETELSRAVDMGHTFSPFLEMEEEKFRHGEAVALDLCLSSIVARERDLISEADTMRILRLVERYRLPVSLDSEKVELIWESLLERSKHRGGSQRVPIPDRIGGCVFLNNITFEEIANAVKLLNRAARR